MGAQFRVIVASIHLTAELTLHCEGLQMNSLLVACLSVGAPLAGMGLYDLQAWLERWDQQRHAED